MSKWMKNLFTLLCPNLYTMYPPGLRKTLLVSFPVFIDHNLPKLMANVGVSYLWQAGGVLINVCGSPKLMQRQPGLWYSHDKYPANRCSKQVKRVNSAVMPHRPNQSGEKWPAAGLISTLKAATVVGRGWQLKEKSKAHKPFMIDPQMLCKKVL